MRNSFWDHLFTSRLSNFDPVIDYFVFDSVLQPYGAIVSNFFFFWRRDISFRSKCWQHNCKSPPVCEHSWTESAVGFGITVELGHTAQTYWKRSTIQFSSFQLFLLVSLSFSELDFLYSMVSGSNTHMTVDYYLFIPLFFCCYQPHLLLLTTYRSSVFIFLFVRSLQSG